MAQVVLVTPDNFRRAETDLYFSRFVKDGGLGKFVHNREPTPIDDQDVVRMNRDTLYSMAVFDLDAGPVTIRLPDSGKRFMSLQVWDEDEYCPLVAYSGGKYVMTREKIGTRYAGVGVRILADPANRADIKEVQALQDAIKVDQKSPGRFETPQWDLDSQKRVREALEMLGKTTTDFQHAFGSKDEVDPVRHLIGAAVGWGGNPEKDAIYLNVTPKQNDGKTAYRMHVPADVPVDGFWSISVYNKDGYFEKNASDAYSVNNIIAAKNADGSVDVQFGGCSGNQPNCVPITPGWNMIVRLYRPRKDIIEGRWKFPEATPVQ